MNQEWIKEQFAEHDATGERCCENGLEIEESDIIMALKKIGVNKAPSYDGMTDIIF